MRSRCHRSPLLRPVAALLGVALGVPAWAQEPSSAAEQSSVRTFQVGAAAIHWNLDSGTELSAAMVQLAERYREAEAARLAGEEVEPSPEPVIETLSDGILRVRTPLELIQTMFAHRGADGLWHNQCAEGHGSQSRRAPVSASADAGR